MNKANAMLNTMQQELQRQKLRLSRNYAEGLITLLHIDPHGKQLITLLGEGDERSNLEALSNWVYRRLQQNVVRGPLTSADAETFRQTLVTELMDFQAE